MIFMCPVLFQRFLELPGPKVQLFVTPWIAGLACCNSWGCKESDKTKRLNWTELKVHQGPVALMVKNLSAMQETWVQSLGQEDPLEKGMATHSSILALRIPWTEEPGRLQSKRSQRVGHDWATNIFTFCFHIRFIRPTCTSSNPHHWSPTASI